MSKQLEMREICEMHQKRMFQIAYGVTRDYYLAQDVVQEALIKAYHHLESVADRSKLGAWLASITTRTAIDFLRKEKKTREKVDGYTELDKVYAVMTQNVEKEAEANELQAKIYQYLNTLSPEQKQLFLLKIKDGLKEREIAEILEMNPNTVKTKLYRMRKQLKELIAEQDTAS
ncbi:RNA polymerase sigma factor [Cytobacillus gottheilii]|uniref:RNA polymerase sigma factor n=1 Tax=Cytobacillus gottheilii TaxID=859144 RepID=UPI0009BA5546|nr:RNA polymerase sigma factor [Cytobacillus gottheilii]